MLYAIYQLIQAIRENTALMRDLRNAVNTNSVRTKHLDTDIKLLTLQVAADAVATNDNTAATVTTGQLLAALIPLLQQLADSLNPKPVHMDLQFGEGEPGMAGQEKDNQTIPCTAIETDADGNPVTLNPVNVTWNIDALPDGTQVAELTQNADGSASFKALKVGGPVNVSCTDNGVTPPLVGTNTLEVIASVKTPTSMALVFGDPQAATA